MTDKHIEKVESTIIFMNNQTQSNSIKRISVASDGTQANGYSGANSLSDDGRFVSFESNASNLVTKDLNGHTDTFIYDRLNNTVELISLAPDGKQANASSNSGSISGNGRYVTYASFASNLVSGDTNNQRDIFLYDRTKKTTELISVASDGTQADGATGVQCHRTAARLQPQGCDVSRGSSAS